MPGSSVTQMSTRSTTPTIEPHGMGHVDSSMAGQYRERISDERLRDVVDVVQKWLWPEDPEG